MKNVLIVYGSEYGAAENLAYDIKQLLKNKQYSVILVDEADSETVGKLTHADALLVVTATTGLGDLPENILPFFINLKDTFPNLESLLYGVIALGDRSYGDTFCQAGRMFDDLLEELKAERIMPLLKIDAMETNDPFCATESWIEQWCINIFDTNNKNNTLT